MESAVMILLDTHIWIWWLNESTAELGEKWSEAIRTSSGIGVSAISCFEVAWLERHGRIELPVKLPEWFDKATTGSGIEIVPITPAIAEAAVALPEHHSDPQDRLIIGTAVANNLQLITADAKFDLYRELDGLRIPR
jgi:PIN domain nuclease of toxin-antitoxin system